MSFVFICATVHVNLCDTFGCKLFKTQFLRSYCVTPLFCLCLHADKKTVQICRSILLSKRPSGTANFHRQNVQCCVVATEFRRCVCSGYQKVKLCRKGTISATGVVKGLQKVFPIIDTVSEFRRCVCSGYQKVKLCRKGTISATGVVKGLQKVFPTIDTV